MKNLLFACSFSVISAFGLFSCGMHDLFEGVPTESRMVEALQEALVVGSKTAASNLGDQSCDQITDCATGYLGNKLVEIALPDTVKNVLEKIDAFTSSFNALPSPVKTALTTSLGSQSSSFSSLLNLGGAANSIKEALNRGAEQAAPASIDVFRDAIFGMSFSDAKGVLMGDSVAATTYLKNTTRTGLTTAFSPIIKAPLDLLNPNQFWRPIANGYKSFSSAYRAAVSSSAVSTTINTWNAYNSNRVSAPSLPFDDDLPTDISEFLAEYATGKALDGLFLMVGKQETALRADPWGTVQALGGFITDTIGDLLGSIFSDAKDGLL